MLESPCAHTAYLHPHPFPLTKQQYLQQWITYFATINNNTPTVVVLTKVSIHVVLTKTFPKDAIMQMDSSWWVDIQQYTTLCPMRLNVLHQNIVHTFGIVLCFGLRCFTCRHKTANQNYIILSSTSPDFFFTVFLSYHLNQAYSNNTWYQSANHTPPCTWQTINTFICRTWLYQQ